MIKVAVGIIMQDNNILLCQRKPDARYGLKWEFPGGKLEQNESPEDCLRRELHEELGINADLVGLFHHQHSDYKDGGSFDVYYYYITDYKNKLANQVFASIAWVPVSEINQYDILEGNREVVLLLIERYAAIQSR